ncbi:MAG: CAF17-like 4Fe-4S cluster assembly/insertion protein YgfZ [Acidimicrobiales bacterium]
MTELTDQYRQLREGCGAYRMCRDVVAVRGPDAEAYLQGQCSQDIAALPVGGQTDSLLLSPEGRIVVLVRIVRTAADAYVLDTACGFGGAAVERLERFKLRSKLEITLLEWSAVGLRGGEVAPRLGGSLGIDQGELGQSGSAAERDGNWLLPVRWSGTGGIDIIGPDPGSLVPEGCVWCGGAAWEALRVEAGIPQMGREVDGKTIAAEAGLVERTVSFAKGCYTGQELVARLDARGNRVARHLRGVVLTEASGGPAAAEDLVGATLGPVDSEKPVGVCTSAAWCPGIGGPAALAYVHRSIGVGTRVLVHPVSPESRAWQAEVRELPMC